MKHSTILISVISLLFVAACQDELSVPQQESEGKLVMVELSAGTQTKVHLQQNGPATLQAIWNDDDKIAVFDGYDTRIFSLKPGSNKGSSAIFCGKIDSRCTTVKAAYPISAIVDVEGGEFKMKLPIYQSADSFLNDSSAVICSATAELGSVLEFNNAIGLIAVPVSAEVEKITIHTDKGENISGEGSFIEFTTNKQDETYYIAVSPGTYGALHIFAQTADGIFVKNSSTSHTIGEGQCIRLADSAMPLNEPARLIGTKTELEAYLEDLGTSPLLSGYLTCDIDADGSLPQGKELKGTFDGQGYSIDKLSLDNALFDTVSGKVRALTLESGCSATPTSHIFGCIANSCSGTLSNITSKVNVSFHSAESVIGPICYGGIVGMSTGDIASCTNCGKMAVSSTSSIEAAAVGGIAGYASGRISDCNNVADVSLEATHCTASCVLGALTQCIPAVGGIAGHCAKGFSADGCKNDGKVNFSFSGIDGTGTLTSGRLQVGGIIGGACGDCSNCTNNGAIVANLCNSSKGTAVEIGLVACIGGIGGGDYNLTDKTTNPANSEYVNCTNYGSIDFFCDASKSNSAVGGIVGWPGQEAPHDKATLNCLNKGKITVNGAGKVRAGGIQGGTGNIDNCTNEGELSILSSNENSAAGGIAAFHSQTHYLKNSKNSGDVLAEVALKGGVAGLIGNVGNSENTTGEGCVVNCKVKNIDADAIYTGTIVGKYNGTTAANVLGSKKKAIATKGSICFSDSYLTITQDNFSNYVCGSYNTSTENHTIYAIYGDQSGPISPGSETTISGHIKYSDGSPAEGISVSDGFSITVTDSDGYYEMDVTNDCWYIYFSYPSNVKIVKNSNGSPDFFKRYSSSTKTYDFTLTKQAEEKEFVLMAMADPQSHNSARGTQKTADTNRFRDEVVPEVNKNISAMGLPCYGVTLGDIVYSENSRNSNGGMSTMRTNFSKINMPVFQTMGNHDYTYFYSSSPLKTDATSSTLYLKAQRKFEEAFGPINYSFNRGDVHIVCLRDINYDSDVDASSYHGGFTNEQYNWLKADLAQVSKDKKVILCVHIPLFDRKSNENVMNVLNLIKTYTKSYIFSGHAHYYRWIESVAGTGIPEQVHNTVCGQWWWSRLEGDGCPNSYTVYRFNGTDIKDAYNMGIHSEMNSKEYQMRIYRGDIKCGGPYGYFQWQHSSSTYLINVFQGNSKWRVKVYEDGVYAGDATLMPNSKTTFSSISMGETKLIPESSNQDWWAIGFHIGVCGRGTSGTSYYTNMFHMFKYTAKNASAKITVEATDPYGNTFVCSDVITDGTSYPDYIKAPLKNQ